MNDHFNISREEAESSRADDSVCVGSEDCHMWLGVKETPVVQFHRVEDCDFVGAEDYA